MRRLRFNRPFLLLATTALIVLAASPSAFGLVDGGEGTYGPASDKVITNAAFMVIAFFPLVILVASLIQWRLDKRRDARKAAAKARRASADWHGGW